MRPCSTRSTGSASASFRWRKCCGLQRSAHVALRMPWPRTRRGSSSRQVLAVTLLGACIAPLNLGYEHLAGGKAVRPHPLARGVGSRARRVCSWRLPGWYTHWLHHHVATLWYFHAIHHSQANLNVLSDNHEHFVESVINATIAYLPARAYSLRNSPEHAEAGVAHDLLVGAHPHERPHQPRTTPPPDHLPAGTRAPLPSPRSTSTRTTGRS